MVDTAKTKTAIVALFADNEAGDISPQDLRDFVESMHPAYGGCYWSTPAATTITDAATYYLAAGTTTETSSHRFTVSSAGRLTYTGAPAIHLHIACSVSFTIAGTGDVVALCIAKNGTPQTGSAARRKVGTGTDIGSTALHWDVPMVTNDYIELYVANEDVGSTTITVENGYLFAMGMFM